MATFNIICETSFGKNRAKRANGLRNKWLEAQSSFQAGDTVINKDENSPLSKLHLAKVLSVKTGKDGLVRQVFVRTAGGTSQRPVIRLINLPTDEQVDKLNKIYDKKYLFTGQDA